ncbi:small ribosomal subunit protein mS39-like [Prorops nasuta]|uniref:small ribosomal subunit protein mS39-like n=1 Tax=Prorops nasuta TaxID=863751 RepID=UPI0034CDF8A3
MNALSSNLYRKLVWDLVVRLHSTATTKSDIKIPNKIERGPTDILKALESTVRKDPLAPQYKYHDDPYLIPLSKQSMRQYALAKDAGRKTAMWIRQENSELFQHKIADPYILAYQPKPIYSERSQVSEDIFLDAVSKGEVSNAVNIYNLLNGEISVAAKQSFLELLCFYNDYNSNFSEEANTVEVINADFPEERYYKLDVKQKWRQNPLINELFGFLKEQGGVIAATAYSTLICGQAKFGNAVSCYELYSECKEKGIPINLEAYNSLIKVIPAVTADANQRFEAVLDMFRTIDFANITPNRDTFNAALCVASSFRSREMVKKFISSIFAELKYFNIEPTLSTFYYAMVAYYQQSDSADFMIEILKMIKNKKFELEDSNDINFFHTAMQIASEKLYDCNIALEIDNIYLTGDNYKFLGNNYRKETYYRFYILIFLDSMTIDEFMKFYESITPHVYIPQESVMEEILEVLRVNSKEVVIKYLPKLWSDTIVYSFLEKEAIVGKALEMMVVSAADSLNAEIHERNEKAANDAWTVFTEQIQGAKSRKKAWSAATIGNIALLFARNGNWEKALRVLSYLADEEGYVIGTMSRERYDDLLAIFIQQGYTPGTIQLLQYAVIACYPDVSDITKRIHNSLPLADKERRQLLHICGNETLRQELDRKESSSNPT